ncbi:MAG: hypothetical protein LQ352_006804 [Teloschistes flavicans]|nr:MAG: hypothetical protein LQ352_006804 [Teloschistes flavicans]
MSSTKKLLTSTSYFDNGRFTDLTLNCRGREWQCHKVIVCSQSRFFEAACSTGYHVRRLDLTDDDPDLVTIMIEFLYMGEYKPDRMKRYLHTHQHIAMHGLGEKYAIPALCAHATRMVVEQIRSYCPNPDLVRIARWAYEHELEKEFRLREKVLDELDFRAGLFLDPDELSRPLVDLMQDNRSFCKDMLLRYLTITMRYNRGLAGGNVVDVDAPR